MRLSGLGGISPTQSKQPAAETPSRASAASSHKDGGEQTQSAVMKSKVSVASDTGDGEVEAYQALQRHAPVERPPKLDFERVQMDHETARLSARVRTGTPPGVKPQPPEDEGAPPSPPPQRSSDAEDPRVGANFSRDL